ncbi:MAG: hypothetical protein KC635_20430, partial [Myxococcales bacterium]|nr:hypothetical protein [Myxococcales bacterium]
GGLGGGMAGGGASAEKTELEAVVMRLEVAGPGEKAAPERVQERVLFSGAAGELPVVTVSLLTENQALLAGERERSTLRGVLAARPALEALAAGKKPAADALDPSEPAGLLTRWADLRRQVQHALMTADGAKRQQLRERTGLVAHVQRLQAGADGKLVVQERIDLVANPIAFVTPTGLHDASAAIRQGVADTALEAALLGPSTDAARKGTAWALLADPGRLEVKRKGALIEVAGEEGAWWSVDPTTGTAVGRVPGGGGQSMLEYAYEAASTICAFSGLFSMYAAATHDDQFYFETIDKWQGRLCSIVTGTEMQQAAMEKIGDVRGALWKIAIPAMLGIPSMSGPPPR